MHHNVIEYNQPLNFLHMHNFVHKHNLKKVHVIYKGEKLQHHIRKFVFNFVSKNFSYTS